MLFMYLPDLSFAVVFAAPIFALNVNPALIVANYFEGCGIFLDQLDILATDQTNFTDSLHPNVAVTDKYMLQKQIHTCCRNIEINIAGSEKYCKLNGQVMGQLSQVRRCHPGKFDPLSKFSSMIPIQNCSCNRNIEVR